jgi:glycosyltransferase involved in cell wall biosynthesis
MLTDHDIIYVAGHDFNLIDSRISTDHIAQQLARHNRILYVESIGLRRPRFDKNDLSRIGRKLTRFIRPPQQISEEFWVIAPLAVPLHHRPAVRWLNNALLLAQIRWASAFLRFRKPILFVFLPHMGGIVGHLGESVSVYYCTDEHAAFPGVDGNNIRHAEEDLLRKVTLGFATSQEILKNKKRINPNFYFSPHGVDFDNFAQAQDQTLPIPEDIRHLPHPLVGYFGAIDHWIDLGLIEYLARSRPRWSFVFIGNQAISVANLSLLPNVHFLGKRPFQDLPRYGRAFDATIIPFRIDDLTISVSPIKLKEYLAMGKPVVSTPLPAVMDYAAAGGLVRVAGDTESFLQLLERDLRDDSKKLVLARQESVRSDTWKARAEEVSRAIAEYLE